MGPAYNSEIMSEVQIWVAVAAPFVAVYFGILLNQKGIERLDKRLDRVEDGVRDVNTTIHSDVQGLLEMISDHGQRIVRLEERH